MMLLRTLLTHYRRHPLQALFLLTGIVVANVLLAGTLLINAQARASYAEGEQYMSATPAAQIRHRDRSEPIDERDYIRLRRQGFDMLAPLLKQYLRTADGQSLELLGIDLFAMSRKGTATPVGFEAFSGKGNFVQFTYPPHQVWAAPARLEQLGIKANDRINLSSGVTLPALVTTVNQQLGHRMLMDIKALQVATDMRGELSSILVYPGSETRLDELRQALPAQLELIENSNAPDPAELTRSFHLNLTAMGLLAFVVGIFLTYNALAFSYTDRRDLIRRLRLTGILKRELAGALLLELAFFLLVGTVIGAWLGSQLAAWLLPGVGRTLAQLYGVYISYPDGLVPTGIWLPLIMTACAAVLCVAFPLRESINAPMLERRQTGWQQRTVQRRDGIMALIGLVLLAVTLLIGPLASQLWVALLGMACLLLGAALLLPMVLRALIAGLQHLVPAQKPRLSWLLADSRWLLGPASLALMAMTLALVANSGLNTMISSFRDATDVWLEQRLSADLYLRAGQELSGMETWLKSEMPKLKVSERYRKGLSRLSPTGKPAAIEMVSLRDGDRFRNSISLIRSEKDALARFEKGEGIYISERAWRIDGWQTGARLELCDKQAAVTVLGVYHDYGNPRSQWMSSRALFKHCWPEQLATGLSVYGPEDYDWDRVRQAIAEKFELEDSDIINQSEIRQAGLAVFDRTFIVTRALNALTLLVAAIGIFCAISAIHHHRVSQQALLSSLGMSRRERGSLLLLQWGVLGLLCMVLVWPFGTALAAYLAAVVTPAAFGWSFPLQLELQHYLVLALLSAACLMVAVFLPSLRLLHTSPAAMLREQNI